MLSMSTNRKLGLLQLLKPTGLLSQPQLSKMPPPVNRGRLPGSVPPPNSESEGEEEFFDAIDTLPINVPIPPPRPIWHSNNGMNATQLTLPFHNCIDDKNFRSNEITVHIYRKTDQSLDYGNTIPLNNMSCHDYQDTDDDKPSTSASANARMRAKKIVNKEVVVLKLDIDQDAKQNQLVKELQQNAQLKDQLRQDQINEIIGDQKLQQQQQHQQQQQTLKQQLYTQLKTNRLREYEQFRKQSHDLAEQQQLLHQQLQLHQKQLYQQQLQQQQLKPLQQQQQKQQFTKQRSVQQIRSQPLIEKQKSLSKRLSKQLQGGWKSSMGSGQKPTFKDYSDIELDMLAELPASESESLQEYILALRNFLDELDLIDTRVKSLRSEMVLSRKLFNSWSSME